MAASLQQFHTQFGSVKRDGIVEVFSGANPLLRGDRPLLNFIRVDGFTYEYNREGSLGGIAFRGLNETYTADTGLVNPVIERMAIFGGKAETDAKLVEKRGNAYRAARVAMRVKAASLFYLKQFFDGDSDADPKSFDGLNKRLTGNQVIEAATNGAAVSIPLVQQLQRAVYGDNSEKVLLMSQLQRSNLSQQVVAAAGGAAVMDASKEITVFNESQIRIIGEDHLGAEILGQDEVQGNDNNTGSIYCVRFGASIDEEDVQGLIGAKGFDSEDQGKRDTVWIDLIDIDAGLAIFHPRAAARLKGLKTALS